MKSIEPTALSQARDSLEEPAGRRCGYVISAFFTVAYLQNRRAQGLIAEKNLPKLALELGQPFRAGIVHQ